MAKALAEKHYKREIKKNIKKILLDKKEELEIKEVNIVGDTNRQPVLPSIILDFDNSSIVEGNITIKKMWKIPVGIVCFLRDNDYEKGKIKSEEIVGQASDFIIDLLPNIMENVHEVKVVESSDDTIIQVDNKTIIGNGILLEIYYFV